jgi:hypothetical protein
MCQNVSCLRMHSHMETSFLRLFSKQDETEFVVCGGEDGKYLILANRHYINGPCSFMCDRIANWHFQNLWLHHMAEFRTQKFSNINDLMEGYRNLYTIWNKSVSEQVYNTVCIHLSLFSTTSKCITKFNTNILLCYVTLNLFNLTCHWMQTAGEVSTNYSCFQNESTRIEKKTVAM